MGDGRDADPVDRDESRVQALAKVLRSFVSASRRAEVAPSDDEQVAAALEARAMRRVALSITADDEEDDEAAAGWGSERQVGLKA